MTRGFDIRRMAVNDWRVIREVRLRALKDAPTAFGSSYEDQSHLADAQWIEKITQLTNPERAGTLLAFVDEQPVGMVVVAQDQDMQDRGWLVSMWVAPEARRHGAGKRLIEHAATLAQALDYKALYLHVTDGNVAATRLYECMGFELTGETMAHPRIEGLLELEMRCVIV